MNGFVQRVGAAIERQFAGTPGQELAARSARISAAYRDNKPSKAIIIDAVDAAIYALTRLPATAAAIEAVLSAVGERAPEFSPKSVLDIGAGPGPPASLPTMPFRTPR